MCSYHHNCGLVMRKRNVIGNWCCNSQAKFQSSSPVHRLQTALYNVSVPEHANDIIIVVTAKLRRVFTKMTEVTQ